MSYRIESATKEEWAARCEIAEARIAELEPAFVECREEIDGYIRQEYPHDHPVHRLYRQRGFSANPARIALAALGSDT